MVDLIVRYLSFSKQVSLKGLGTFSIEHLPARLDFPNRLLHAPQSILHYSPASPQPDELFDQWLGDELNLSLDEVKHQQQILLHEFQRSLNDHHTVQWDGLGSFAKTENQVIQFSSSFETVIGSPVKAEKIIRKNKEHFVRVGEEEKTSTEMEELLFGVQQKKLNLFWIVVLALFLLSFAAVWMFAASHSRQWGMQGNGSKMKTDKMPSLYKIQ